MLKSSPVPLPDLAWMVVQAGQLAEHRLTVPPLPGARVLPRMLLLRRGCLLLLCGPQGLPRLHSMPRVRVSKQSLYVQMTVTVRKHAPDWQVCKPRDWPATLGQQSLSRRTNPAEAGGSGILAHAMAAGMSPWTQGGGQTLAMAAAASLASSPSWWRTSAAASYGSEFSAGSSKRCLASSCSSSLSWAGNRSSPCSLSSSSSSSPISSESYCSARFSNLRRMAATL